jgi:hypothetical protein
MTVAPERVEPGPTVVGTFLFLLLGPLSWSVQFSGLYLVHTLLCVMAAETKSVSLALAAVTAVPIAGLAWALTRRNGLARELRVLRSVSDTAVYVSVHVWLSVLSAIAMLWSGLAAAVVAAC